MHRNLSPLLGRVERALETHLKPAIYAHTLDVPVIAADLPGEPVPFDEAIRTPGRPLDPGTPWGRPWGTTWMHVTGTVPEEMAGRRVELSVDLGFNKGGPGFQSEGLAYDAAGVPVKGVEPRTTWLPVSRSAVAGERFDFWIEAASNPRFTETTPNLRGDLATTDSPPLYTFQGARLGVFDEDAWHLALDVETLHELAKVLPENSNRQARILQGLCDMLDHLDVHDVAAGASRARDALAPLLASPAHASAVTVSAVGHAHIDSAWLWPVRETQRKCARTFANVVTLAEEYPDFVFACSQAVQYQWVKDTQPGLWTRIKAAVERGQFVPVGGMWVESDTNMVGSEAMVRQFTQGQRFFDQEFGITCHELWIPDTFGYSGALPQIARLAGCRWFLTQKMSWNRPDKFPHSTFWWEGIDGTRIFTHFPPSDTYSGSFRGFEMAANETNFAEIGRASEVLYPFGYGDGGGGPTREMMELGHRMGDLEGVPRVTVRRVDEFFERAMADYPDAPVWSGEMYLEFHRGVQTTQIKTKQGNRASEHLLSEAELWCAQAAVLGEIDYPYDDLDAAWRATLLLQFHDILPGSSIHWVHREAEEMHADLARRLTALIDRAQRAIAGEGAQQVRFNAAPHDRAGIPARGSSTTPRPAPTVTARPASGGFELSNGLCTVVVGRDGNLASVVETSSGREVLAGPGNQLQMHYDTPRQFDAWDIDEYYRHSVTTLDDTEKVELVTTDEGPEIRIRRRYGDSTFEQTVRLADDAPRVDFTLDADWHAADRLVKAAFPIDVQARHSTAEVQFGQVERPTHDNTSWDAAQFEIAAQRWLHIGEPGFGVALLNRGGYGHDVSRARTGDQIGAGPTIMRYTLLRSPQYPDPTTDQGRQHFEYSLLVGDTADALREGAAKALPERVVRGATARPPLVATSGEGVVVTAVKLADDRSGDLIVRCYESAGRRTTAQVTLDVPVASIRVVDLLERDNPEVAALTALSTAGNTARFPLRGFQIVTLRIARR